MLADRSASSLCRALRVLVSAVLLSGASTAGAATVPVSSGSSIADAVRSATAGDTIEVGTGDYDENLALDKNITIQAANGAKVVITGVGAAPVVTINSGVTATLTRLILRRAGTGVLVNGGTAVLQNLVIAASTPTGTAIECQNTAATSIEVTHATIDNAERGIVCAAQTFTIDNNIISNVTKLGMDLGTTFVLPGTTKQLFFRTPTTGVTNFQSVDSGLAYVDPTGSDFHLTLPSGVTVDTSPAIDKGTGKDSFDDTSTADLGAYGGPNAPENPFPPRDVQVVCVPAGTACAVKWTENTDYNVTGYRVYLSYPLVPATSTQVGTPYATGDVCRDSPCQHDEPQLDTNVPAPDPPGGLAATFGDGRLYLTWSKSANATSYRVLSGTTSGSLSPASGLDRVEGTSATLDNLVNGTTYYVAVAATTEPTLTASVASLYGTPITSATAGERSDSASDQYGTAVTGTASAEVSEIPEPVVGFPPLAESGGCFIATAAYGSPLAPQVSLLRAWRDRYLKSNPPGRVVVRVYETVSPPIADVLRRVEPLRAMVRWALMPVIGAAWISMEWPWLSLACGMGLVVALAAVGRSRRGRARG